MRPTIAPSILALLVFLITLLSSSGSMAAEKYAIGEEVEIHFLNSWMPATVRDVGKKGEVLAEFSFANTLKQQVFAPDQVRHQYEAGAMVRGRLWSDASGKFKIKAALLKISGGKAVLRSEDSKELSVAIDKLSPKDQTFLKQFQKQAGLAALPVPGLPTITEFDTNNAPNVSETRRGPRHGQPVPAEDIQVRLSADPIRKGLEMMQAGVGFPSEGHHEKLSSLIPLGGPDKWLLASIGEREDQPTRLMWVALAKESVKKIQMLPAGEMLMDYHAASRQMLTYSKRKLAEGDREEHPVLTVWQAEPSTEEPKAVLSWNARLPGDSSWHNSIPWVRFANQNRLLQRTETHRIMAWDLAARRLVWSTPQESFFAPEPSLSAGGKYLFLPEDSGLRIIDAENGTTVSQVAMDGCTGVGVHADGRHIAAANQNDIYLIDITGSEPTRKVPATSVGSPFKMKFFWVGDRMLCFDTGNNGYVLYSLEVGLPIWTYTFDYSAYSANGRSGGRLQSIVDDHLVYAASFNVKSQTGLAVGAVAMPGEKAQAAIAGVKRDDLMAIKAGARFRIDVSAIDHPNEIRQAIEKEVKANQWFVDSTATNTIKAEYKRGEARNIQYELRSERSGDRQVQSASVTPFVASLKLFVGQEEAWQSMSSSGPPPTVAMKEGDSLQAEVDRWNKPNWEFFSSIDIPNEIIDPKKRGGVGKTSVTNRGLMEQSIP